MDRTPAWAGKFYPADPVELRTMVRALLGQAPAPRDTPSLLAMSPHAGYDYSGGIAALTLKQANLHPTILLLGPKHTVQGASLALWPHGAWHFPGGHLDVAADLCDAILAANYRIHADTAAHWHEHSLEVLLPFLHALNPATRIAPLTVADPQPETLAAVATSLAAIIQEWPDPISIVVSSDMSHFLPQEPTKKRDAMALERIKALNPEGLYATVHDNDITMCGVLPMTVGLMICRLLGATSVDITAYATSGDISGDFDRVVGYAGALVA
ncbi:MAG: AmmeMemoRadiSam system protein B [Desulfovibrionaceae bacterium]